MEPATCRFFIAGNAISASSAVAHCTLLHAGRSPFSTAAQRPWHYLGCFSVLSPGKVAIRLPTES
jgi:hypothetical protein